MINLLPSIEKRNLSVEKKKKIAVILWFLLCFLVVCLILVLFTVKVYVKSQVKIQESLLSDTRNEEKREKVNNYRSEVKIINSRIKEIEFYYKNQVFFSDLLEEISASLPENIFLEEISLAFKTEEATKKEPERNFVLASLKGFAPTRESLLSLKDNLEKFNNVSFPPSNWLEKFNIDFSVSFEVDL